MPRSSIQVLSIHDRKDSVLAFDLKDILDVLRPYLNRWTWYVLDLDCVGDESMGRAVEQADGSGVPLPSEQLIQWAGTISQTIDGTFIAYPHTIEPGTVDVAGEVWSFPVGRAELVIRAVDSSFFEVYTKDPTIGRLLQDRFHDVRSEDPALYFDGN